jgi:hypothetical protein
MNKILLYNLTCWPQPQYHTKPRSLCTRREKKLAYSDADGDACRRWPRAGARRPPAPPSSTDAAGDGAKDVRSVHSSVVCTQKGEQRVRMRTRTEKSAGSWLRPGARRAGAPSRPPGSGVVRRSGTEMSAADGLSLS